jgi:BirA family biotin operon repressor/biotin-[acetyl-CoA-carboxylase] ligase
MTMSLHPPEWHDTLSSTNSVLAARLRAGESLAPGFVLAAREQTAGRGRFDRTWAAAPGRDLTFSLLLGAEAAPTQLASLPMAAALAVAELIDDYGPAATTKWPNDVLVGGRKICGILAEQVAEHVVLGIGLNVNMTAADAAAIDRPATSLLIETGDEREVADVLDALLPHLDRRLADWRSAGFTALAPAWRERCHNLGQTIEVGDGDNRQRGVLLGFGEAGQLRLRREDGREVEIWAGDVAF